MERWARSYDRYVPIWLAELQIEFDLNAEFKISGTSLMESWSCSKVKHIVCSSSLSPNNQMKLCIRLIKTWLHSTLVSHVLTLFSRAWFSIFELIFFKDSRFELCLLYSRVLQLTFFFTRDVRTQGHSPSYCRAAGRCYHGLISSLAVL